MSTQTITAQLAPPRRGLASTLGMLAVAGLAFVAVFALPYFTLNEQRFGAYWPLRWWLLVHIVAGIVALLTGPLQLWFGLTDRRMETHRKLGLAYITSIVIGAVAGIFLAFNTEQGGIAAAGLIGLAAAWIVTTGMAYLAIRRQLYDQHKEWMIRSYVVTFAFVSFRIVIGIGQATGTGDFGQQFAIGSWASWAVPLLVTEAILQGRKILAVRA